MPIQLANNASGTLATAISASDTGLALTTGDGAQFPALGIGDYFYATLASSGGTQEIVKATARSGDSLTIVRAQEGTTAQSFAAGSRFEVRVTAQSVADIAQLYANDSDISLRNDLAAASGSSLVGFQQAGSGTVLRTAQAKLRETVSVKDFGAVGDGVTDDGPALALAVAAANGKVLDLGGLTYLIKTSVNVTVSGGIEVRNGKFIYDFATATESGFQIRSPKDIYITNLFIDGQNTCAKLLFLRALGKNASAFVYGYHGQNAFQTFGTTGLASILQCGFVTNGTDEFKTVHVVNSRVENVDSSNSSVGVGRGIYVEDAYETLVTNCHIENIGPYGDGDGVFAVTNNNMLEKAFVLTNCTFKNCHKRSIKSQTIRSFVGNITCYRTVDYPAVGGQSEISLQNGGVIDGVSCYYADNCFPKSEGIVSCIIRDSNVRFVARNILVNCENINNVIPTIVFLGQAGGVRLRQPIIENINFNCYINYFVATFGTGIPPFTKASFVFVDAIFSNIEGRGFNLSPATDPVSGQLLQGFVRCLRGATEYIQMTYSAFNIRIGSNNSVQSAYLDTSSGNLVYLQAQLTKYFNCVGFDTSTYNGTGIGTFSVTPVIEYISPQHIIAEKISVNEDETVSRTYALQGDTMCKIILTYVGSAGASRKLYTEGFSGSASSTDVEYFETVAGNKSNATSGAISITANAGTNTFTIAKSAGSGPSFGRLIIIIQHVRNVTEV
jgi:hypothetical protein